MYDGGFGSILGHFGVGDEVKKLGFMSKRGCSKSTAKANTEATFGGSNGVVVELKSRPKSS